MDGAVDLFMYFASCRDLCLLSISRNHSTISLSFLTIVNKTSR